MKLPQMIAATAAAFIFGYLGSQCLNKNIMYAIGGGMLGIGALTYLSPSKSEEKQIYIKNHEYNR